MLWFNGEDQVKFKVIKRFQYILCCGSTIFIFHKKIPPKIFQYILCCGSTYRLRVSNQNMKNFNTSYVVVQL